MTRIYSEGLFFASSSYISKINSYLSPTGADSLEYLSVEGLVSAIHYNMKTNSGDDLGGHCTACLTGEYPGGLPDEVDW